MSRVQSVSPSMHRATEPALAQLLGVMKQAGLVSIGTPHVTACPHTSPLPLPNPYPPARTPALLLCATCRSPPPQRWNTLCDDILSYARQRLFDASLRDPQLRARLLPSWLRGLGFISDFISLWGFRQFTAKYKAESSSATRDKADAALKQVGGAGGLASGRA